MSSELARAIDALNHTQQLVHAELAAARGDRELARRETPGFLAELQARRNPPRQLTFQSFARIPGLGALFARVVPGAFVAQVDHELVEISCPCGSTPQVARGQTADCECGRCFLHAGGEIRVAFTPEA